jgi:riboflavin kinase / FMN adenylyltransferase
LAEKKNKYRNFTTGPAFNPMNGISDPMQVNDALSQGKIREANELSGSPYMIRATVVHGNHLGRTLGFPTANLHLIGNQPFILPMGVYAVYVQVGPVRYGGMANAGIRPTIGGTAMTVEVHLFGFSGDLYGCVLEVFFIDRIREERKFDSLNDLVKQLRLDQDAALRSLT